MTATEPKPTATGPDPVDAVRRTIRAAVDAVAAGPLAELNAAIHARPELAYEEVFAHDAITAFVEQHVPSATVTRHAYGLRTAFEADIVVAGGGGGGSGGNPSEPEEEGKGGGTATARTAEGGSSSGNGNGGGSDGGPARLVVLCAEYDALPGMGHACGHNLIATSSVAAFVGLARAVAAAAAAAKGVPGDDGAPVLLPPGTRVRLLGCPAEESGGGKIRLVDAGAFAHAEEGGGKAVSTAPAAAAIMAHPHPASLLPPPLTGVAGFRLLGCASFRAHFRGVAAHAAAAPWLGKNALDGAVGAYVGVAMMRQGMRGDERVHGVFEEGGSATNVIPEYARMAWIVRAPAAGRLEELLGKVKGCCDTAAAAAGVTVEFEDDPTYKDLRINDTLCEVYAEEMEKIGEKMLVSDREPFTASTDMGNVSYAVPSLHSAFGVEAPPDIAPHNVKFAEAAGTTQAFESAIRAAKGMAVLGWRVLTDDSIAEGARRDFETNSNQRHG